MNPNVLVAMSGGVDSSVAAALLKEQGFFVCGAYMKNFSPEAWQGVLSIDCPWQQDFADASAVAKRLDISFQSFNFEREYREKVIEYFFAEYAAGRTPNPDVVCNKEIKFGLFLEKAIEMGFDYIATGHYARVQTLPRRGQGTPQKFQRNFWGTPGEGRGEVAYQLLKGLDPKKDQSYFLCELNQDQLSKILFPIGEYTKPQVREMARKFGLPTAEKKDSQGVCFIGHINLREFLKQRIPERVGEIVTTTGQVVGQHHGAAYFTIGQREGLGIGGGVPYYVVQKDVVRNRLVVSPKGPSTHSTKAQAVRGSEEPSGSRRGGEQSRTTSSGTKYSLGGVEGSPALYSKSVMVKDIHWIGEKPKLPLKCSAKIRYQQEDQGCTIFSPSRREGGDEEGVRVQFAQPQFAPAAGQAVVFYDGEEVLGGGMIA